MRAATSSSLNTALTPTAMLGAKTTGMRRAQAAMRGANAAVVGILGAALYDPVWTSAVHAPRDLALALTAFVLLTVWNLPPWVVVGLTAFGGTVLGVLSAP